MTPEQVETQLGKLKDFQRRTVEHVFRRFYRDQPEARRFLVADEVGLGKTLVARGLIAKAIRELEDRKVGRIDVIYVCSNAAIAHQNLRRLNVFNDAGSSSGITFATRLTLLPEQLGKLTNNRVNFVSFTPGTTFDLKSRAGKVEERAVLYRMLLPTWGSSATALRNLLQCQVGFENWKTRLSWEYPDIDPILQKRFSDALVEGTVGPQLKEALERFRRRRENIPSADLELRYAVIGQLRQILARVCVDALEPDLIILDEFQRFRDLLASDSEAGELAQMLFNYPDARLLLLSATPYRMFTLADELDDDHHRDFIDTVRFLLDGDSRSIGALEDNLATFRRALVRGGEDQGDLLRARSAIESCLRKVMTRTERVRSTVRRDAMLEEQLVTRKPEAREVDEYVALDELARSVGASDVIHYWKSAPHLLSSMEDYELKRKLLRGDAKRGSLSATTRGAFGRAQTFQVRVEQVQNYQELETGNARLRALKDQTVNAGAWRLLWLPPALPYIAATGPYAGIDRSAATKALVFSSWAVAPKAIATMLSYEVERRMVGENPGFTYEQLSDRRSPLLTFSVDRERGPGGMTALALLYPCATLMQHIDTLELALDLGAGQPAQLNDMRRQIATRLRPLVDALVQQYGAHSDQPDQRWYWASLPLLDQRHSSAVVDWIRTDWHQAITGYEDEDNADDASTNEAETRSGLQRHLDLLVKVLDREEQLGRPPADLLEVIADLALASPAICAGRAICRVSHLSNPWDPHLLSAAAHVAWGFRTFFNVPETTSLLGGGEHDRPYWRRVLDYCVDGNLQAVLDEYAHLLVESTGMIGAEPAETAKALALTMTRALSPRSAQLQLDELRLEDDRVVAEPIRIRCRYAMRFGDLRNENGAVERADVVRDAFNSPFRPFVLASTSIGQEGLDFHSYCHAVYHWNLPSNPVDLEQREGRVHRYKSHAVRRNLAIRFGLDTLKRRWSGEGDPWSCLFEVAAEDRPPGANELIPYWIFETEGGVRVERRIPLLPFSREQAQLRRLKRQLALYRLAFGQPRQEDLITCLEGRTDLDDATVDEWRIRLEPMADAADGTGAGS